MKLNCLTFYVYGTRIMSITLLIILIKFTVGIYLLPMFYTHSTHNLPTSRMLACITYKTF